LIVGKREHSTNTTTLMLLLALSKYCY
jgi:hypothetical protein